MAPKKPAQRAATKPSKSAAEKDVAAPSVTRRLIGFAPQTLQALLLLSHDTGKGMQALADEAFGDLLKKHGRPPSLKDALRQSTRQIPANDRTPTRRAKSR